MATKKKKLIKGVLKKAEKKVLTKVKLKDGRYSASRDSDGMGDSGHMLLPIDPSTASAAGENGEIIVGCCMQIGTFFARSYQMQDYWMTTPVVEIISISKDKREVKLKTKNSYYTVKSF